MTKKFDVFGIGQCSHDYIGIIKGFPKQDEKCEFSDLVIQGGGPVATGLVALQRWGLRCAFSGVVGDDSFGQKILEDLRHEHIDLSGVQVRPDSVSQFAFSVAEPDTGRRTLFWRGPTGKPLDSSEIDTGLLRNSRFLFTDGYFPDAAISACKVADRDGIPVIVDAGSMRPALLDILPLSDYFIASEAFARDYMPGTPIEDICKALCAAGPALSAITLGSKGHAAVYNGDYFEEPAYKIKVVDTTGCGDVFHAGFIYGLLKSWPIHRALRFAAWSAAMVGRFAGGRTGIPDPADWPG